jgi:Glycosyltransferase family 87
MEAQYQREPSPRSNLRTFLWILLFLAAAEFVIRGPVRFLFQETAWNDLSQNYTASKLWLNGQSPSDPRKFVALWKQERGSRLDLTDIRTHLAPPLGGLVVLAHIAAFHWNVARILWTVVLSLAFAATVWALALAAGLRDGNPALAFVAACLALAPFHTGIASGNPSILVIGFCALAILAAVRRHDVAAGILFGLACSLKPHIGAGLVLYYLVQRRWQLFTTAVATTVGLFVFAALYLWLRGASWIQDYLQNAKGFVSANSIDDFSSANPSRFTLINLQVPFFSLTGHSSSANYLALAVGGTLLLAWLYWVFKGDEQGSGLLPLGAIAIISLLPVYHRFYDAALLALPLCWCMSKNVRRPRKITTIALVLMIPFLVPGTAFLQQFAAHSQLSNSMTCSWWWDRIVMPHETWALLFLSLILIYAMKLSAPGQSQNEMKTTAEH